MNNKKWLPINIVRIIDKKHKKAIKSDELSELLTVYR